MKRLAVLLLVAACGGDAESRWSGSVETLPNGAVRVSNPAQGVWEEETRWRLTQEQVLGTIDGPEPTVFAAVIAIEVDSSGRVYVLDRQANQLRIFDAAGEHIRSVGRAGEGPGEYANANGLLWMTPDTLVVIDQRGNRYSILTSEGEYVRSVARSLGFYGWSFSGAYRNGTLYEQTSVGRGETSRPALLGTALRAGVVPTDAAVGASLVTDSDNPASPASAGVDTVYLPLTAGPAYESFRVQNERGGMVMGVPFTARPVYRIDGAGDIWHGRGSEFRIVRSTFTGDTLMEIMLEAEPVPVTADELRTWQEGPAVAQFLERGGKLDLERIPRVKPFFDDLLVDDEEFLWVFRPTSGARATVAVFDPRGRYMGTLHAEGLHRDPYIRPIVRNGRLYIVGRDDLDVQHIFVFRIDRAAEESGTI